MEHIKKYWFIYAMIMATIGIAGKVCYSDFELKEKIVMMAVSGQVVTNKVLVVSPIYQLISIVSNVLISLAAALVISLFFIRSIENIERKEFQDRLMEFQRETAKNAVFSVYNQLIEPPFFTIIKEDLFENHLIRRDVKWQYDIEHNPSNNTMLLTRTIRYHLSNQSRESQDDKFYLSYIESAHSTTSPVSVKFRVEGESRFNAVAMEVDNSGCVTKLSKEGISIPAGKSAEVVMVMNQLFPREYIYETHFINSSAIDLELTVNIPVGFIFELNTSSLSSTIDCVVDEPNKKIYKVTGAIYRGQGLEFICSKLSGEPGEAVVVASPPESGDM